MAKMAPPPGGREVQGKNSLEPFFVFRSTDGIEGVLIGRKSINGQESYLFHKLRGQVGMKNGQAVVEAPDGIVGVLPNHVRLMDLLEEIAHGSRLWIEPSGEQELKNRTQPLKLYRVIDYGPPSEQLDRFAADAIPEEVRDDDVSF